MFNNWSTHCKTKMKKKILIFFIVIHLPELPRENKHMTSPAGKQTNKHMRRAHVSLIQLLFRMWNARGTDAPPAPQTLSFIFNFARLCHVPGQSASDISSSMRINQARAVQRKNECKNINSFFVPAIRALTINNGYKMSCQIDVILNETIIVIAEFTCFLSVFDLCDAIFIFVYTQPCIIFFRSTSRKQISFIDFAY